MTTKLEQEFFEAMGVEPDYRYIQCSSRNNCDPCITPCGCDDSHKIKDIYPTITDTIVLRLICILNCKVYRAQSNYRITEGKTLDELINNVLKECIQLKDEIREEVQQLLK